MSLKLQRQREWLKKRRHRPRDDYPLATLAYYGPTDQLATKLVAAVLLDDDGELDAIETWLSEDDDIRSDAAVFEAMIDWLKMQGVQRVAMVDRIIGCPHEEVIDYPEGEACPRCPFWAMRDRFSGESIAALAQGEPKSEAPDPGSTADELIDGSADERDIKLVYSPLCQVLTHEGVTLDVQIYGSEPNQWLLEVVNERGTSIVWDDPFENDEDALAAVLETLKDEGIRAFADE